MYTKSNSYKNQDSEHNPARAQLIHMLQSCGDFFFQIQLISLKTSLVFHSVGQSLFQVNFAIFTDF